MLNPQLERFVVTEDAARLIRLQRTCYRNLTQEKLGHEYYRGCARDLGDIIPFLPFTDSILDIGAGMGGVDVLLFMACPLMAKPHLYLFDLDRVDEKISYGFSGDPSAYSSLTAVREFLEQNGVNEQYFTVSNSFPESDRFDLTISLISMGFHYPVDTYLSRINTKILILDIRKGTNGIKTLRQKFKSVRVLRDYGRYERVVCE